MFALQRNEGNNSAFTNNTFSRVLYVYKHKVGFFCEDGQMSVRTEFLMSRMYIVLQCECYTQFYTVKQILIRCILFVLSSFQLKKHCILSKTGNALSFLCLRISLNRLNFNKH